jgi:MOSC domain-containing protein YiiM
MEKKMTGELVSVQVGKVQRMVMPQNKRVDDQAAFWTSGIFKEAVSGAVRVFKDHLEGDEAADPRFHGGPDNVALVYDVDHYPIWREQLGKPELTYGGFGENFSVRGFSDESVCIGDVWRIGKEVVMQVTQSRQPCFKLARRLENPMIVKWVRQSGWGGWYLRVLQEGVVEAGMGIEMIERMNPAWTVVTAVHTMYLRGQDLGRAKLLAELPELSERWKKELVEE